MPIAYISGMGKSNPMNLGEYELLFKIEDEYWWFEGIREVARSILEKHLPRNRQLRILDAGCGTGGNLNLLGGFGDVFGIELCREASRFLKRRSFSKYAAASIVTIPFASASFDLVSVFYVNEYLKDDSTAFLEYYRVLKPGGYLYVIEVAFEALRGEHDLAVGIMHRYTRPELCRRLAAAGFNVIKSSYANTILCPAIFLLRKIRGLLKPVSNPEEAHSEFDLAPGPLHSIFKATLLLEARLLKSINLPFGVSVLALAQKPEK